jgi:CBS domain containing-hemolysin-like protein
MGSKVFDYIISASHQFAWFVHVFAEWHDGQDLGGGFKVSDQNMSVQRWLIVVAATLGVFFCLYLLWVNASIEAALKSLTHARLHGLTERHESRVKLVTQLLDRPAQVLSAITTLNVICFIIAPALAISAIHQFSLYGPEVSVLIIILTLVVLAFARAVPKGIATQQSEVVALRWSNFVNTETAIMSPLVKLTNFLANLVLHRLGVSPLPANTVVTHEELALLANQGAEEGIIHREERQMIEGIFEFGDTIVREVMVPRLDIKSIPQTASLDETLDIILKNGHSRLPVYAEDIDHIIGVLYAKDLLRFLRAHTENTRFELGRILRQVYYVPESKKADMLFQELQNRRVHIAIVIDEYGGTAGLVTIEDLLEEIVGEIQDEYDTETPQVVRRSPDEFVVDARLNLEEANDLFHTHWESENVDTIGGFVYDQLGRIPAPGDELVVEGVSISVLTLVGNRLTKLLLTQLHPQSEVTSELPLVPETQASVGLISPATNTKVGTEVVAPEATNENAPAVTSKPAYTKEVGVARSSDLANTVALTQVEPPNNAEATDLTAPASAPSKDSAA